jgi:ubiquinol oxidase
MQWTHKSSFSQKMSFVREPLMTGFISTRAGVSSTWREPGRWQTIRSSRSGGRCYFRCRRQFHLWARRDAKAPGKSAAREPVSNSTGEANALKPPVPYGSMLERERKERPGSAGILGLRNFVRESRAIALDLYDKLRGIDESRRLPGALALTLDDAAVNEREKRRDELTGYLSNAPWISRVPYEIACRFLDWAFTDRPIARFWFLETVARMPYFSYLSVLHLYETFNWLHLAELRRTHFAEEWNELHHLLIMSALGGDAKWSDRFLAYHLSIIYYWLLVVMYIVSPRLSYNFSELLEKHAVDTYEQFLTENEHRLKALPAPAIAVRYYANEVAYTFQAFGDENGSAVETSRPPVQTLYDAFLNIRLDEEEHVRTMEACQNYDLVERLTSSPYLREQSPEDGVPAHADKHAEESSADQTGSRAAWNRWADAVNQAGRRPGPDTRSEDADQKP